MMAEESSLFQTAQKYKQYIQVHKDKLGDAPDQGKILVKHYPMFWGWKNSKNKVYIK